MNGPKVLSVRTELLVLAYIVQILYAVLWWYHNTNYGFTEGWGKVEGCNILLSVVHVDIRL